MLDWIIDNKEWLFSGVGVKIVGVILTALITVAGWLFWKRRKDDGRKGVTAGTDKPSVQHINIGSGNVAGRDQAIAINCAVPQTNSGSKDNAKQDKTTKE